MKGNKKNLDIKNYINEIDYAQLLSKKQRKELEDLIKNAIKENKKEIKKLKREGNKEAAVEKSIKVIKKCIKKYMKDFDILKDFIGQTRYVVDEEFNSSIVEYIYKNFNSGLGEKEKIENLINSIAEEINAEVRDRDVKKLDKNLKKVIKDCIKSVGNTKERADSVSEAKDKKLKKNIKEKAKDKDKDKDSKPKEKKKKNKKKEKKLKEEQPKEEPIIEPKNTVEWLEKVISNLVLRNVYNKENIRFQNLERILNREIPDNYFDKTAQSMINLAGIVAIAISLGVSIIALREYLHNEITKAMFANLDQFTGTFAKIFNLPVNSRFVVSNMVEKLNIISDISQVISYLSFTALALLPLIFLGLKVYGLSQEFNGRTEDIAETKKDNKLLPVVMTILLFTASLSVSISSASQDLRMFLLRTYDDVISAGNNAVIKAAFVDQANINIKMYIAAGAAFAIAVAAIATIISSGMLVAKLNGGPQEGTEIIK